MKGGNRRRKAQYRARTVFSRSLDKAVDVLVGAPQPSCQWAQPLRLGRGLIGGAFTNVNGFGFNRVGRLRTNGTVDISFLYALGKFSPPPSAQSLNAHVGPVLPAFAGWSMEPDTPPVAIIGLGYEEDRALGAVE